MPKLSLSGEIEMNECGIAVSCWSAEATPLHARRRARSTARYRASFRRARGDWLSLSAHFITTLAFAARLYAERQPQKPLLPRRQLHARRSPSHATLCRFFCLRFCLMRRWAISPASFRRAFHARQKNAFSNSQITLIITALTFTSSQDTFFVIFPTSFYDDADTRVRSNASVAK